MNACLKNEVLPTLPPARVLQFERRPVTAPELPIGSIEVASGNSEDRLIRAAQAFLLRVGS